VTPRAFAIDFIRHWEDGDSADPVRTHSLDPVDAGNWSGGQRGIGKLVGSNHGVTAAALATHRGVPVAAITRDMMHALTIGEAADIALDLYFRGPGLDALPWNRVTMSVFDMGWGAGPPQAIKLLQRLIGAKDDGQCGPGTVAAYRAWLARYNENQAAMLYADARKAFYGRIIAMRPDNAKYANGWERRTASYTPVNAGWWSKAA
jgi:lysozyme family protein